MPAHRPTRLSLQRTTLSGVTARGDLPIGNPGNDVKRKAPRVDAPCDWLIDWLITLLCPANFISSPLVLDLISLPCFIAKSITMSKLICFNLKITSSILLRYYNSPITLKESILASLLSGAGKSTLINALAHRTAGRIFVEGDILVNGHRVNPAISTLAGYVHQNDLFLGSLTVSEHLNFMVSLRICGIACVRACASLLLSIRPVIQHQTLLCVSCCSR